jgi:DNA-binding response OmpR family regulator
LAQSVIQYLKQEGNLIEHATNFRDAVDKIEMFCYDCIIVDLTLPDGNGLELLSFIRKQNCDCGILILSARNSLNDKVDGLEKGADDYLTKPFHLTELNARLKSIIRRRSYNGNAIIEFNEIAINTQDIQILVNNSPLILTRKEYELILYFVVNRNRVITKESISEHLWGDNMDLIDSYDFIYTHIKNIRKKIIEKGGADYIKTIYGMGYKFSDI